MRVSDAVKHFGTQQKVAEALGITKAAVSGWGELVPKGRAYELQILTGGALDAGAEDYEPPAKQPEAAA